MKDAIAFAIICLLLAGCEEPEKEPALPKIDWTSREARLDKADSLIFGKSYLPIYSRIYHHKRDKTYGLTITASLRNVSATDTVYLLSADLYGTTGDMERSFIEKPVYLKPLETLEIVIEETEAEGGTGGNFTFEWAIQNAKNPPLFEAVMISTLGQQGISFTTPGLRMD